MAEGHRRDATALRKDIRFTWERHLRYIYRRATSVLVRCFELWLVTVLSPGMSHCQRPAPRVVGTQEVSVLGGTASRCTRYDLFSYIASFLAQGLVQLKASCNATGTVDYANPSPHLRRATTVGPKGHKSWISQVLHQVHEDHLLGTNIHIYKYI